MGPGVTGLVEGPGRQAAHARRRPARRLLHPALPQPEGQATADFIRGYGFEGEQRQLDVPGDATDAPGFGAAYKKHVRDYAGAFIDMGGFGEVLPRYENARRSRPGGEGPLGHPVLRFHYQFGDNEKKMAADMADTAKEMFDGRRHRDPRASAAVC